MNVDKDNLKRVVGTSAALVTALQTATSILAVRSSPDATTPTRRGARDWRPSP